MGRGNRSGFIHKCLSSWMKREQYSADSLCSPILSEIEKAMFIGKKYSSSFPGNRIFLDELSDILPK